jgi:hypothetical protein
MSAEDTVTVTVPSWVEHIALPEYPAMPILAFVMLGFGTLLLLIGYFAPIKKNPVAPHGAGAAGVLSARLHVLLVPVPLRRTETRAARAHEIRGVPA